MFKWVFGIATLVVGAGLFFAFKYGVAPRPIPLIKPSKVANLEEAGVLAYRRMRQDIHENQVLLAGSLPMFADYPMFWQGFVLGAREDGARVDKIFSTPNLALFKESQVMPQEMATLDQLRQLMNQSTVFSERVMFYLPSTESSHLNVNSFSKWLDKKRVKKISITLHSFHASKGSQFFKNINCELKDPSFIRKLDCLGRDVTRFGSRKDLDPNQNYVALYRYGLSDYVAFWYQAMKPVLEN